MLFEWILSTVNVVLLSDFVSYLKLVLGLVWKVVMTCGSGQGMFEALVG